LNFLQRATIIVEFGGQFGLWLSKKRTNCTEERHSL